MPRFVRPFWLHARIDGRATVVETGPRSKDGGIDVTIHIREDAAVSSTVMRITGSVFDGWATLRAVIDDPRSPDPARSIEIRKPI